MPDVLIDGVTIRYETMGSGTPVVLTPGGRWGGYVMKRVATELAKHYRVITWDRPNTDGASGIVTKGDVSEADIWCGFLAGLIRKLELGPCYVGEYAGCRTTPLLCVRHPELVKGLMLAWPSGGEVPAERLPKNMYRPYMRAALRGGMAAVCETPMYAAAIQANPAVRGELMAQDPVTFVRQFGFWEAFFTTSADLPTAGCRLGDAEWASIRQPAIVTGGADPIHPTIAAQRIQKLIPGCRYHDPVVSLEEWDKVFNVLPYPKVSDLQGERIAPVWLNFIKETNT